MESLKWDAMQRALTLPCITSQLLEECGNLSHTCFPATRLITGIDVNCPNKDGITPLYLATIIGGDSCQIQNSLCKVGNVIKSYGRTLQFPTMEAEYFLIFNIFFGINHSHLFLELTREEILALQQNCGRDECQEYHSRNMDLFKTSDEVDRVHNNYKSKVDKCSRFIEACPSDIKTGLCHFSYVMLIFDKQVILKYNFLHVRNSFIRFLDEEIERLKKLVCGNETSFRGDMWNRTTSVSTGNNRHVSSFPETCPRTYSS